MSIFDCSKEMKGFHNDCVTLRESDRHDMRQRRNAGRKRLQTGLEAKNLPLPARHSSQGSYAMRTMIQDDECDYDIDDGVYFNRDDLSDKHGDRLTPEQAKRRVADALNRDNRLNENAKILKNCVRQNYPEGYHIDMPVYRLAPGKEESEPDDGETDSSRECELASGDSWVPSDARAVTTWFDNKKKDLNDSKEASGYQMRRIVRLTKAFARSRKVWKPKVCSGITLTKLICDELSSYDARDDQCLYETWKSIGARLDTSTIVNHPVGDTPLAEEGDSEVTFFKEKLDSALETLSVLEDGCTRGEALEAWDEVFNTDYFSNQPGPDEPEDKSSFFISQHDKTDKRSDGGGRYGSE